jgi:hypothetical protein
MTQKLFFWVGFLAVIALPFGTRVLLHSFTPGFHEYEAMFLYASDIPLILFVALYLGTLNRRTDALRSIRKYIFPVVFFLAFAAYSIMFAKDAGLGWYSFVRLLLGVCFAFAIAHLVADTAKWRMFFGTLVLLAVFESVVAFLQFRAQGSIGLGFLGESPIGALMLGTAKSILGEGRVVRAYGTFPHPNVLGAFLLIGLSALYYFWFSIRIPRFVVTRVNYRALFKQYRAVIIQTTLLSAGMFMVLMGLLLTFSRVAWMLAVFISLLTIFYFLFFSHYRRQSLKLAMVLVAIGFWLQTLFAPFIIPRAQVSLTEPSVVERISYNRLGVSLIREHPFGVGIGNQVLTAVEDGSYARARIVSPKLWQPIHNLYLLIASEIGFLGVIALLIFLAQLVIGNRLPAGKAGKLENPVLRITSYQLLITVLLFALFDHFFWTLEQGRLLFWLVIGIVLAVNKTIEGQSRP